MPTSWFQIPLSVRPQRGGAAELPPPPAFADLHYAFVIVKEGGAEAIVQLDADETALHALAAQPGCQRLTAEQVAAVRQGYPAPRLKQRYRTSAASDVGAAAPEVRGSAEERPIDTFQTVRAGFYLIDVLLTAPVSDQPPPAPADQPPGRARQHRKERSVS